MNNSIKKVLLIPLLLFIFSCDSPGGNENTTIIMTTTLGDIKIKLYDDTPIHRDNFIKLVNAGFYDGISFHRVIKDFMIQAGDPATKTADESNHSDTTRVYTIPAEILPQHLHKKGALAAARQGNNVNPEMRSSGTQFYIVEGKRFDDNDLNQAEQRINNNIKQALFSKIMKQTADSLLSSNIPATEGQIQEISSL